MQHAAADAMMRDQFGNFVVGVSKQTVDISSDPLSYICPLPSTLLLLADFLGYDQV
jgi:hypothetical protein